ncbi:hypothetical protein ACC720_37890, partial [Rhizobium ruizarguesonis]
GFIHGVQPYSWTQVVNIKRDPFETSVGAQIKTLFGMGGAIASPSTAYVYDPKAFSTTSYDLVKPGGIAVVSTPFHGYWKNLALDVSGKMDDH